MGSSARRDSLYDERTPGDRRLITPWNYPIAASSTGSTDAGATVYDTVTADGERILLERDGKTPALVSATANPDEAAGIVARERGPLERDLPVTGRRRTRLLHQQRDGVRRLLTGRRRPKL
jgi:hypothetical protein